MCLLCGIFYGESNKMFVVKSIVGKSRLMDGLDTDIVIMLGDMFRVYFVGKLDQFRQNLANG